MSIVFFDAYASVLAKERQLRLERFHVFQALSLPAFDPALRPIAWNVAVGVERSPCSGDELRATDRCVAGRLDGGAGAAFGVAPGTLVYGFPLQTTVSVLPSRGLAVGWNPRLGVLWEPHPLIRLSVMAEHLWLWPIQGPALEGQRLAFEQVVAVGRNHELRFSMEGSHGHGLGPALRATGAVLWYF